MSTRASMLDIVYEHNTLNGFWFVLVEFVFVAAITIVFSIMAAGRGNVKWTVMSLGVATNAAAICVTVINQIRRGERSSSIVRTYLGPERADIARAHPHLARHTLLLTILVILPFVLAMWLAVLPRLASRQGRS